MRYQQTFVVDPRIKKLGVRGDCFILTGLKNTSSSQDFDNYWNNETEKIKQWIIDNPDWKNNPILAGFRNLHTAVGRSNRDYVSSPENLISLLSKRGSLPRINLIVDIYNLVSLKYRLALGAHDLSKVEGDIRLGITKGDEGFVPLGSLETKQIYPGEYAYIDGSNDVLCRMEVRQAEKTKVGSETTDCFYIVQGNLATDEDIITKVRKELRSLTQQYCGNEIHVQPLAMKISSTAKITKEEL